MTPDEFVALFTEGWRRPQPDAWIEFFRALSHPDVVAEQPLLPAAVGPAAYMRSFRNTFGLMKDAKVEVRRYAGTDDDVYIESVLSARIGGRRTRLEVCDHFELVDGLIHRRRSYFDPTPLVVSILLRPWVLPRVVRCLRG